jgi:hypothetical protein
MERTQCVICDHIELASLVSYPDFPATTLSTNQPLESDMFIDFHIAACQRCGCPQLRFLVDPSVLYTNEYTTVAFSPTWRRHHDVFADFVKTNMCGRKVLEVGGNAGALLQRLPGLDYSVLDMFRHNDLPTSVTFVQGNCESFDYTGHSTVILSHVFEHLYHPKEFVASVRRGGVQDVFLAIPNFETELGTAEINVLNTQHTFYCDAQHMKYVFAEHGYTMNAYHSHECRALPTHMMHFKYVGCQAIALPILGVATKMADLHAAYARHIPVVTSDTVYVSPAGATGQMLWYHMKQRGVTIRGFLDNSVERCGKRLYGTDHVSRLPRSLTSSSDVFVCPCKYASEITLALSEYTAIHIHGSPDAR